MSTHYFLKNWIYSLHCLTLCVVSPRSEEKICVFCFSIKEQRPTKSVLPMLYSCLKRTWMTSWISLRSFLVWRSMTMTLVITIGCYHINLFVKWNASSLIRRLCLWTSAQNSPIIITVHIHHIAYLRVHSLASSLYFVLSVLYILAISGTRGSSGFGSVSSEQMDNNTGKQKCFII